MVEEVREVPNAIQGGEKKMSTNVYHKKARELQENIPSYPEQVKPVGSTEPGFYYVNRILWSAASTNTNLENNLEGND